MVGKEVLCPGFATSIPGASPSPLRNPSNCKAPTHPALHGHWGHQVEKGQSWPALSPCSIGPAWSHPAGWPESCSRCGLLRTGDGGDQFRRTDAEPAPSRKDVFNLVTIGSHQRSHCCLCHEAGVPGSCGRQLREICLSVVAHLGQSPPDPASNPLSSSPRPLSAQRPSLPLPQLLPAPPGLT